jgi:two-component system, response regulator YesN
MYRLLYADDEALSRYAFRTLISKNFANIEVVGEAEDGNQAVELFNRLKPDIIVLDIRMPGLSGLEVAKTILKASPSSKILILTAYDNFDYLNESLDIGIRGYIVKPFKKEEIISKLSKVLQELEIEKETTLVNNCNQHNVGLVKKYVEKELILKLISGINLSEAASYLNFLTLNLEPGYFMLVALKAESETHISGIVKNKFIKEKAYNLIETFLSSKRKSILGPYIGSSLPILFCDEKSSTESGIIRNSLELASELKQKIKLMSGIDIVIGIGSCYTEISDFKKSYDEAFTALKKANEKSSVEHFKLIIHNSSRSSFMYPFDMEEKLLNEVKAGNVDSSRETCTAMLELIFSSCDSFGKTKELTLQMIVSLKRLLYMLGDESGLRHISNMIHISEAAELDELKNMAKVVIDSILERIHYIQQNKDIILLTKISKYIDDYLTCDLSLNVLASNFDLSPQYISKMFKNKYGMNFIDYITEKRLNYAKHLLRTTTVSIGEVGSMSGYTDINYFCKIFKKSTGMTPKRFRTANSN